MNPSNFNASTLQTQRSSNASPTTTTTTTTGRVSKADSSLAGGNTSVASLLRSYPMKRTKRTYRRSPASVPSYTAEFENKENVSKNSNDGSVKSTKRALAASDIMNETTLLDLFHTPMDDATMDITERVNNETRQNM
ncbi:meiosis inducing protein Mei3 [Schizosaccharomyces octosporus yFS286]|uniref:Meiosis inducing protein Mei3 n=1 Tax=Schizosaccharomyces octosporus (strain yFS286) TaxID=483514 RepID=S9PTA7_SCHOY|nr:meiosis inducing protein Mei3 [Schizosaccharomyces octosporus yFS286]EPX71207.1 meiosis inducing protein Mei3 [Schizosaccharomyces octosporus yFS286]